jgi:hypothetical protein
MDGWRDASMDGWRDRWMESFISSRRPLLYVILIPIRRELFIWVDVYLSRGSCTHGFSWGSRTHPRAHTVGWSFLKRTHYVLLTYRNFPYNKMSTILTKIPWWTMEYGDLGLSWFHWIKLWGTLGHHHFGLNICGNTKFRCNWKGSCQLVAS